MNKGSLWKNQFGRFLVARTAASLGDSILIFALPLIIFKLTGSIQYSGIAFFIEWLPRILWLPFAGIVVDRLGGRKVLIYADSIRAGACILTYGIFTIVSDRNSIACFVVLTVLSALIALLSGQTYVALESQVSNLLAPADIPRGQSLLEACNMTSMMVGPGIAALLTLHISTPALLIVSSSVYFIGYLNLLTLPNQLHTYSSLRRNVLVGLKEGWVVLSKQRNLIGVVLLGATANLIYGSVMASAAAITKQVYSQSDQSYALLISILGLMSLASLVLVPIIVKNFNIDGLRWSALAVIFGGALTMAMTGHYLVFVLGFGLLLGGITLLNIFIRSQRALFVPKQEFGRVVSLMILFSQIPMPISGLMVAKLGASWQPATILGVMTVLASLIACVACILLMKPITNTAPSLNTN